MHIKKYNTYRLLCVFATLALAVTVSLLPIKSALAATGTIYVSPISSSVVHGSNVTVSIRINPGTTIDSVQGTLNFDATKLTLVAVNTASSAFTTELQNTTTGSSVTFARGDFGAGVSGDALVETVTFSAKPYNGSTSLTISGGNADSGGTLTGPTVSGATLLFSAGTCPTGQVGTPPSCTTPPPAATGTGSGSTGPTTTGTGTTTTPPKSSPSSSGGASTGTTAKPTAPSPVATQPTSPVAVSTTAAPTSTTVAPVKYGYTNAEVQATSSAPTQVYVKFGVDGQLDHNTAVSDFATSHTLQIDPALLVPGETYSYVVVSTNKAGAVTQTDTKTFTLKGMNISVAVLDAKRQPIRNQTVTLHSQPYVTKTDSKGFAVFNNVVPGDHHVTYQQAGKTYSAQLAVANNLQTKNNVQSAPLQNVSVVYSAVQSSGSGSGALWIVLVVLAVLAVLGYLLRATIVETARHFVPSLAPNTYNSLTNSPVVMPQTTNAPETIQPSPVPPTLGQTFEPTQNPPIFTQQPPIQTISPQPVTPAAPQNIAATPVVTPAPSNNQPGSVIVPEDTAVKETE